MTFQEHLTEGDPCCDLANNSLSFHDIIRISQ